MCTCDVEPAAMGPKGCRQALLECTHNNCEVSRRMRRELSAALLKGDTDDMVLDSFVKEYGTSVLVAPRMSDIPTRLWVLASVVLLVLAASIVFGFVRMRHARTAIAATPRSNSPHIDPDLLRRVRAPTKRRRPGGASTTGNSILPGKSNSEKFPLVLYLAGLLVDQASRPAHDCRKRREGT